MNGTRLVAILLIVLMLAAVAQSASADKKDAGRDGYIVPKPEPANPWLAVLFMLVGMAGVLVVAFRNARRTHLD